MGFQVSLSRARRVAGELGVVDQGHGVPVLRQPVALAVLDEKIRQAALVLLEVDLVPVDERLDVQDLVAGHELRVVGRVVGPHVGRAAAGELGREVLPVLRPRGLGDLDADAGVGLRELVGARLVGRLLLVVPQPVLERDLAAAVGAGPAVGARVQQR
ncbi:hypothetical protein GCM10020218_057990 [Dactylosporangium vinaceum]